MITLPVVTTGSFDGVHLGHRVIINRLNSIAREIGGESVVITFHPHPRRVLHPDTTGKGLHLINTLEEKLYLLEEAGLDNVIIIEFTREFAGITSEQFVRDILTGILRARVIVVGFNHHFGRNQEGDYRKLWEWQGKYGFKAEEIPEQEVQEETVSSTRIRESVASGYMQKVNAYMSHYYLIIGRSGVFESLNDEADQNIFEIVIDDPDKLIPPQGLYAARFIEVEKGKCLVIADESNRMFCMAADPGTPVDIKPGEVIAVTLHKKLVSTAPFTTENRSLNILKAIDDLKDLIY